MVTSRLALAAAALLLVPAAAYTDAATPRTTSATVAGDAQSYLESQRSNVALSLGNGYTATFLTLTHEHVAGTTLDITVTKTGGDPRFAIAPGSGTISSIGGTFSVSVTDTAALHTPTSDTLTVRVDATVKNGVANVGAVSFSRSVGVTV